jgi:hypothetical protein
MLNGKRTMLAGLQERAAATSNAIGGSVSPAIKRRRYMPTGDGLARESRSLKAASTILLMAVCRRLAKLALSLDGGVPFDDPPAILTVSLGIL